MQTQIKLKKVFTQALTHQRFANAYLLVGENAHEYPDKIVAYITNEVDRVKQRNYRDYIKFQEDLKKEDVKTLQKYFMLKPSETFDKKIYAIINVENASIAALNALLKFIEEPVSPTIAILTTTNKERVLPTIVSRCQVIVLDNQEKQYSEEVKELYQMIENEEDFDKMFVILHQNSKKYTYSTYFDVYQLLIEKYARHFQVVEALVLHQNKFEKSCNINLVLDQTLFSIKKNN